MNNFAYSHNRAREDEENLLRLLIEQELGAQGGDRSQLREQLRLSAQDYSSLVLRLQEKGWLRKGEGKLYLTPVGTQVARELLDRHQTTERFFKEILGEPLAAAHAAAEKLEHVISRRALEELKESLARARGSTPLVNMAQNQEGTVIAVKDPGERSFSRLMGMGLCPGARLRLIDRLPDGTTIVEISGSKIAVAAQIAHAIFIMLDLEDENHYSSRTAKFR